MTMEHLHLTMVIIITVTRLSTEENVGVEECKVSKVHQVEGSGAISES